MPPISNSYSFKTPAGTLRIVFDGNAVCRCEFDDSIPVSPPLSEGGRVQQSLARILGDYFDSGHLDISGIEIRQTGTPFQQLVWSLLPTLPSGSTVSYAHLADMIEIASGHRTHARAVARALAQNKVAVLVPCHRVICSSGSLGGYRWGVDKKQFFLTLEKC